MKNFKNYITEVLLHNPTKNKIENHTNFISFKKYIFTISDDASPDEILELVKNLYKYGLTIDDDKKIDDYDDISEIFELIRENPQVLLLSVYNGVLNFDLGAVSTYTIEPKIYNHFIETLKTLKQEYSFEKVSFYENIYDNEMEYDEEETYYIDDLISNFNSELKTKKITKYVYHGTSTDNLKKIMKIGLRSGYNSNWKNIYDSNKYSFFSTNKNDSIFYARKSAYETKSFPVILKISSSSIDINDIDFDYDFYTTNVCNGHIYYDAMYDCSAWNTIEEQKQTAKLSHLKNKMIGATYKKFAYSGNIYPKYIKSVIYSETPQEKMENETDEINYFIDMVDFIEEYHGFDDYVLNFDYYEEAYSQTNEEDD